MRRTDRERDAQFAYKVMDRCSHGVVAISTGEDAPYCLPLSLVRMGRSLYFHCAHEGRKADLLRSHPKVCVSFVAEDTPVFVPPAMYSTYFQSAIATGTAVEVTQETEKIAALRALCEKLTPGHMGGAFDQAIEHSLAVTAVWRIDLDQVTGKEKAKKYKERPALRMTQSGPVPCSHLFL